jgi:[ribosomal protein S5]-alanine N-acetyltransferase
MRGEPLGPEHLDVIAPLFLDPRMEPTMGPAKTLPEIAERLELAAEQWARDGWGQWALFDRETGALIGRGGPGRTEFDSVPEIELGWVITPERWGEGLATELGRASVELAFGSLGIPELIAFTTPDNIGSRRVMEKLGFAYERTAPHPQYGDLVLYRLRSA